MTVNNIEGVQRRAARFVCNDYGRTSSVTEMMRKLGWQPLAERRRDKRLAFFYSIINNLVAVPADSMHIKKNQRHQRKSHSQSIKVLSCCTDTYKNSFVPRTILDWNSLTESIINCENTDQFKTALLQRHFCPSFHLCVRACVISAIPKTLSGA